jgi:tRNA U34 2-thiouridine synthase MnmA/TrmU
MKTRVVGVAVSVGVDVSVSMHVIGVMKTQATGAAIEAMFQFNIKNKTNKRLVSLLHARELA